VDNVCFTSHIFKHMQRKFDDLWEEYKNVGLVINSFNREEICVNTTVNQDLTLNTRTSRDHRTSATCVVFFLRMVEPGQMSV
jgi:hypothetical protein